MKLRDNFQFPEDQKGGILIMDSGIGSLSLLASLNKSLPQVPLIAFADQAFFPYGEKEEHEILNRLLSTAEYLVDLCKPKTLLVACNTASTLVLPELRSRFDFPIVGIVPGIKPAALLTESKRVILLATQGTVKRKYIDGLIDDFASDCEVIKIGTSRLASLAEQKMTRGHVCLDELREEISEVLKFPHADCLILGCTHFSFLREELEKIIGAEIKIIDPVEPVTRQVLKVNTSYLKEIARNYLLISAGKETYANLKPAQYGIDEIIYL